MHALLHEPLPDWSHDEGCGETECCDRDLRWVGALACLLSAVVVLGLTVLGVWALS